MRSMTGYGASQGRVGRSDFVVEVRSVNHRFCETNIRLPGRLSLLEHEIAGLIRRRFSRGRFDLFVKEEWADRDQIEMELAIRCQKLLQKIQKKIHLKGPVTLADLLSFWGLYAAQHPLEADGLFSLRKGLLKAVDRALVQLQRMRDKEGAQLKQWFQRSLRHLHSIVHYLSHQTKVQTVALPAEENVRRSDITEEIIRLKSHLKQLEKSLQASESSGRKMDFLAQEMAREINTVGSKVQGVRAIHQVIDFKTELEKIREQVQNVE